MNNLLNRFLFSVLRPITARRNNGVGLATQDHGLCYALHDSGIYSSVPHNDIINISI